jgi:hypothetical protein
MHHRWRVRGRPPSGLENRAFELYIVVNSGMQPYFQVRQRSTPTILMQAVGMMVQTDIRRMLDRVYVAAKRAGVVFNVATIPEDFDKPSHGAFDPDYMKALFQTGYDLGNSVAPFRNQPPPYPTYLAPQSRDLKQSGANR